MSDCSHLRLFSTTPTAKFWQTLTAATRLPPTRQANWTWTTTLKLSSPAKSQTCRCTAFADMQGRHVVDACERVSAPFHGTARRCRLLLWPLAVTRLST